MSYDFTPADKLLSEDPNINWTPGVSTWYSPTNDSKHRVLDGAVEEAIRYRRDVCNQHCGTHLYFKNGIPFEQRTGEYHDCPVTRTVKMFKGHYNEIQIGIVMRYVEKLREAPLRDAWNILFELERELDKHTRYNTPWALAFNNWKITGDVPKSKDVEQQ